MDLNIPVTSSDDNSEGVLVVFVNKGISYSKRVAVGYSLHDLKVSLCNVFQEYVPSSLELSFNLENKIRIIETDSDLQSRLCLSMFRHEDYFHIAVNLSMSSEDVDICSNSAITTISSTNNVSSCASTMSNENARCDLKSLLKKDCSIPIFTENGQLFPGGVSEFKLKLLLYCLRGGYRVKMIKNDMVRVTARCSTVGCQFRVHASTKFNLPGYFVLKTSNLVHSCGAGVLDINHPPISSKLVKRLVIDFIRSNPLTRTKDIVDHFRNEYDIILNYYFAYKGKQLAIEEVHGSIALSYHQLNWYVGALKKTNPGSYIDLELNPYNSQFERIYIGYEACKKGFVYCRPMIILDGTFMKGKNYGCLMSATAKNGNDGFFPIAHAIVSGEDESNWSWFLSNLQSMLSDDRIITFISDRHPAIISSVSKLFPNSCHSYCIYHMKNNLRAMLGGDPRKEWIVKLFVDVAYAPTHSKFEVALKLLRDFGGHVASKFLNGVKFEHFANAFFPGKRYGEMASNIAESFNSWVIEERHLPITSCLDSVRIKIMDQISKRRQLSQTWKTEICPTMEKRLNSFISLGHGWIVKKSDEYCFEVLSKESQHVDLLHHWCCCNMWTIDGFPCPHAIRAIRSQSLNVYEYIDQYFSTAYFRASYFFPISPVPNTDKPEVLPENPAICPPIPKRGPGRPAIKRKPSIGEAKKKRKCGKCRKFGHNKSTCPLVNNSVVLS